MDHPSYLTDVLVFLLATVVAVPLFRRLGLAAVLGYVGAGAIVGPHALGLVAEVENAWALAEFGVVFLLFTIGLELPLDRLRALGLDKLALGLLQILLTLAAATGLAAGLGLPLPAAIVIGGAFTLSSTAMVLQLLTDRSELSSQAGRTAFSVLLIQDLAVGPLLVVAFALGGPPDTMATELGLSVVKALAAVVGILAIGRWVVRPLFAPVASAGHEETFTAMTLLVVLATGLLTELAGLSMAFGAFLAGMLLADTRYRHHVGAVIQPFRGLLLGLFFMTVGMSMDMRTGFGSAAVLGLIVAGLFLAKTAIITGIGAALSLPVGRAVYVGLLLGGSGEFGFVLLGVGASRGLLPESLAQLLSLAIAVSMALTPFVAWAGRRILRGVEQEQGRRLVNEPIRPQGDGGHIIVAGFGRAGRACAERLRAEGTPLVGIDVNADNIALGRRLGFEVFHGDATRPEVLEAARVEQARAVIVAFNDPQRAVKVVGLLRYIFPRLHIAARAHDPDWAQELRRVGCDEVAMEMEGTAEKLVAAVPGTASDGRT